MNKNLLSLFFSCFVRTENLLTSLQSRCARTVNYTKGLLSIAKFRCCFGSNDIHTYECGFDRAACAWLANKGS
jgi:hypothetical protein